MSPLSVPLGQVGALVAIALFRPGSDPVFPAREPSTLTVTMQPVADAQMPETQGSDLVAAKLDRLHGLRDQAAALDSARALADAAVLARPQDAQVLWRAARVSFDFSDDESRAQAERSRLGKLAWELAERAVAADPRSAEAHYWAALAIGRYAEGIGILKALASGIEGQFKGHLQRATELAPTYDHGSIPVVWAAYHLEVPWPKRDRKRAETELNEALRINPDNLRARLYLARLFSDTDRRAEARVRLSEIAAAPTGRYDAPEERRVKHEATELATKLGLDR